MASSKEKKAKSSQVKRSETNELKHIANKSFKSSANTAIKKATNAINNKESEQTVLINNAVSLIDKAVSKGVWAQNKANRLKSNLLINANNNK